MSDKPIKHTGHWAVFHKDETDRIVSGLLFTTEYAAKQFKATRSAPQNHTVRPVLVGAVPASYPALKKLSGVAAKAVAVLKEAGLGAEIVTDLVEVIEDAEELL